MQLVWLTHPIFQETRKGLKTITVNHQQMAYYNAVWNDVEVTGIEIEKIEKIEKKRKTRNRYSCDSRIRCCAKSKLPLPTRVHPPHPAFPFVGGYWAQMRVLSPFQVKRRLRRVPPYLIGASRCMLSPGLTQLLVLFPSSQWTFSIVSSIQDTCAKYGGES